VRAAARERPKRLPIRKDLTTMHHRPTLPILPTLLLAALPLPAAAQAQAPPAPAPAAAKATPAAAPAVAGAGTLATPKDRLSYAMGMDLGTQLKTRAVDIDPALFDLGLRAALAGSPTLLTPDEAKAAIAELQKAMVAQQAAAMKAAGAKNRAEGDAFLAANKAKEGVVTLPSGLQYKVLAAGAGPKPTADDTVMCHYRLAHVDGTEIESSYTRGEPVTIAVKAGIKGWGEVLPLMAVGSKWQVVVPPDLAYGERAAGPQIGPSSTLVFEIELLSIK
jgi:FKBP-type peptidyl-prolyl cis-trans isomerase